MSKVHYLPAVPECEDTTPRAPYSFDIAQTLTGGYVLIDACVPATMAVEFLKMLERYRLATAVPALCQKALPTW